METEGEEEGEKKFSSRAADNILMGDDAMNKIFSKGEFREL